MRSWKAGSSVRKTPPPTEDDLDVRPHQTKGPDGGDSQRGGLVRGPIDDGPRHAITGHRLPEDHRRQLAQPSLVDAGLVDGSRHVTRPAQPEMGRHCRLQRRPSALAVPATDGGRQRLAADVAPTSAPVAGGGVALRMVETASITTDAGHVDALPHDDGHAPWARRARLAGRRTHRSSPQPRPRRSHRSDGRPPQCVGRSLAKSAPASGTATTRSRPGDPDRPPADCGQRRDPGRPRPGPGAEGARARLQADLLVRTVGPRPRRAVGRHARPAPRLSWSCRRRPPHGRRGRGVTDGRGGTTRASRPRRQPTRAPRRRQLELHGRRLEGQPRSGRPG